MSGTYREEVHIGSRVWIVQKKDQKTGKLTEGIVAHVLTNTPFHPQGIKVRLEDGSVGRIKEILS